MIRRKEHNRSWRKGSSNGSTSATKSTFVASTSGHRDEYFTTGSTKDATAFQDTLQKLARHVSTAAGWKQGPLFGKTITNLRDPVFDPPTRPVCGYYRNTANEVTTDRATGGTKNVVVMDDLDHAIETGEYFRKISRHETMLKVWGDNDKKTDTHLSSNTVPRSYTSS